LDLGRWPVKGRLNCYLHGGFYLLSRRMTEAGTKTHRQRRETDG
jgi:hypothetical protein